MGLVQRVFGVRKAEPEEIDAMQKEYDGVPEYIDWMGKCGIYPDVTPECIQLGAIKRWNKKNVRVSLNRVMSGSLDSRAVIDLTTLDKRITKIIIEKDF